VRRGGGGGGGGLEWRRRGGPGEDARRKSRRRAPVPRPLAVVEVNAQWAGRVRRQGVAGASGLDDDSPDPDEGPVARRARRCRDGGSGEPSTPLCRVAEATSTTLRRSAPLNAAAVARGGHFAREATGHARATQADAVDRASRKSRVAGDHELLLRTRGKAGHPRTRPARARVSPSKESGLSRAKGSTRSIANWTTTRRDIGEGFIGRSAGSAGGGARSVTPLRPASAIGQLALSERLARV